MQEKLIINCPSCGQSISLDETLAGPMIAQVRSEASALVAASKKEAEAKIKAVADKEAMMAEKEKEIAEREASVANSVNQAVAKERIKIAEIERENAKKELAPEIEAERKKATELANQLATSQRAELTLRQEKDALEQRAKALDLEVARKVDEKRKEIHEQAAKDADEKARLRLAEKDKTITDMQIKLEEAQRKATQGSQQMQGEVLELDFEATLRQYFPQDTVEPVKTGARGGDVLQRVMGEMGRSVGTIFWETKRAQAWGGDWAAKAKKDSTEAKAEIAVIVSEILPKGITDFGPHEGVWVTRQAFALVLGAALRQGVISTATARQSAVGKESKMERLYAYMIGSEFRANIEGIALPFRELHNELMAEKRTTLARWKRQEQRIDRVLTSVASLQGDLQGIAGSEMAELSGFDQKTEDADAKDD
jgi:hypothetical protein